jgi:membrane protein YqaA with SNARE-associated domain
LFLSALLAATIIPFSSDVVLVGVLAAGCEPILSVAMATLGNWLGGLISYWMGWLGKTEWLERWFHVKHATIVKHKARAERWGPLLAILAWVPLVGDVYAIVLGFYKVKFWPTAWWMLVGKCGRYICWALLEGALLG